MLLLLITNLAGAPTAVQAVAMLSGVVAWLWSWWRTAIKFTPTELMVTRLIAPYHVPWYLSPTSACTTCGTATPTG